MTAAPAGTPPATSAAGSTLERNLKIAVIAMGVLIVLGVLTVIGRIIYLASRGPAQSSTAIAVAPRLALPAGAQVRTLSLSADRLAVHFDATTGAGIAIVDLATGRTVSRIELVAEPPRK